MESDDGVILRSAHMMVGALAGSLAHVTCKVSIFLLFSHEKQTSRSSDPNIYMFLSFLASKPR